jgi:FKBP-type peptidyl-prolyl cis-trans isomerase
MKLRYLHSISIAIVVFICSCHEQPKPPPPEPTQEEIKQQLIKSHIMYVKQQTDEINQYIKQHNYDMQATQTGIHYMIYEHGKGELAKSGKVATVSYVISLLNGTVCYDSKKDGPKQFLIGEDEVESGVHQAVQLMHVGDKGLFIIPSYLANGLVGDKDKIPPGSIVLYDISLLAIADKR